MVEFSRNFRLYSLNFYLLKAARHPITIPIIRISVSGNEAFVKNKDFEFNFGLKQNAYISVHKMKS